MIEPMLALKADKPFDDADWLFEVKIDGGRCISHLSPERVQLISRSGRDITSYFPELSSINQAVNLPCVLDGELASPNLKFNSFAKRVHTKKQSEDLLLKYPIIFYVFDVIEVAGQKVTHKPLIERKSILNQIVKSNGNIKVLTYWKEQGTVIYDLIEKQGLEGVMAKRMNSTYQFGRRSVEWLKIKCLKEEWFTVYGATIGENRRGNLFGSLILGDNEGKYIGRVGSGFNNAQLQQVHQMLTENKVDSTELRGVDAIDKPVLFWTKPIYMVEVTYHEIGTDGHLRFPSIRNFDIKEIE